MECSNKKCNSHSPLSIAGEGCAPRGLRKPPLSALSNGKFSQKEACNTKKETEVSLQLSNFVLLI